MRNKRLLIASAGAVIFGLVAAFLVSRYLSSYALAYKSNVSNVVVAKVDIPAGSKIIAEQLSVVEFPLSATPAGVFESRDKLVGRIAAVSLAAREPITNSRLAPEGSSGGLSAVIPEGYRAMTVGVNEVVGVSGFLQPGTLVDIVVVTSPPPDKAASQGMISKIVLQNIKVLASGQSLDQPKNDRTATTVNAVTLLVTPEQAEKLALATSEGRLQLVMRNSIDQGDEQTPGANKSSLLTGERATLVPDLSISKVAEQPRPAAAPVAAPARRVARSRVEPVRYADVVPSAPPVQSRPRNSVEMFEGVKKRTVDFP